MLLNFWLLQKSSLVIHFQWRKFIKWLFLQSLTSFVIFVIVQLYYNEHLRPTDISKGLNIDNGYITKIIKQDERYQTEKEQRKQFNKQKHKEQTIAYIKEIRHSQKEEYEILQC